MKKRLKHAQEELMKSNTDLKLKITEMKQAEAGLVEEAPETSDALSTRTKPFFCGQ